MRKVRPAATCLHCRQWRKHWAKGLCQKCYLGHGTEYPELPRGNQHTSPKSVSDAPEKMPARVYAVVTDVRSPLSGRLTVLVAWFPTRKPAIEFAADNNREKTLRVYEWRRGDGRPADQRLLRRFRRRDKRVGRGPSRSLKRKRKVA